MPSIFDRFNEMYDTELSRPKLEEQTYPAVIIEGPTEETVMAYLHFNPAKNSMSYWWGIVINHGDNPEDWTKKADLEYQRNYVWLGKVAPPAGLSPDEVKALFLEDPSQVPFVGTPSGGLRFFRNALYSKEAIKDMGVGKYDVPDFIGRKVEVLITHEPHWDEAMREAGMVQARISRVNRFTDSISGEVGTKMDLNSVAVKPKAEVVVQSDNGDGTFDEGLLF